jgi:hypothetical protein
MQVFFFFWVAQFVVRKPVLLALSPFAQYPQAQGIDSGLKPFFGFILFVLFLVLDFGLVFVLALVSDLVLVFVLVFFCLFRMWFWCWFLFLFLFFLLFIEYLRFLMKFSIVTRLVCGPRLSLRCVRAWRMAGRI